MASFMYRIYNAPGHLQKCVYLKRGRDAPEMHFSGSLFEIFGELKLNSNCQCSVLAGVSRPVRSGGFIVLQVRE